MVSSACIARPVSDWGGCECSHPVREHRIFIDDACVFYGCEGKADISDAFNYIKKIDERYITQVQNDIIIATVAPLLVC